MKGSRALMKMLEDKNVDTMFGYPGGQVIPIFDEILESSVRNVLVRHEQCAAHMADGYARATGRPGVCLATSGPGATNLVTGVATAFADSSPMLVLTGQVATKSLGLGAFQEVDAFSLMMPVTKHNFRVLSLDSLPEAITKGWKISQTGRQGPVHIDLPVDTMNSEIEDESILMKDFSIKAVAEDLSGIDTAVSWIKGAKRPVILSGGGVVSSGASAEVTKFAEMLRAPVIMPLLGLGTVPADHPLSLGSVGMHGRMCSLSALKESDLIIAVGTRFSDRTHSFHSQMAKDCRIIQIDVDSVEFDKHDQTSVNILADAKKALTLMMKKLGSVPEHKDWCNSVREFKRRCACDNDFDQSPILPQRIMKEINNILDKDTIITTDVGQNQMWAMHHLKIQRPRQLITSGGFGTMGFGFPAAIGAKVACPEKKVMTITGDGGLLMVIQELATAVGEDIPVVICLLNNGWLGMVKQWQNLFWDDHYSGTQLYSSNPDFVKVAEAFGAKGMHVEKASELKDAFKTAFESDRPFLIDIKVDPEENCLPMLPPNPQVPIVRGRCPF